MTNSTRNSNSRLFSPFWKFSRVVLALPLILLAACGGGGDDIDYDDDDYDYSPPSDPSPEPPDVTTVPCLDTASGDCLTNAEFTQRARELTTALRRSIRSVPGASQNWARDAFGENNSAGVNAYEAYANLYLVKGGTAAASPGKGVHIGILDTGIDLGHPDFAGVGTGSRRLQEGAASEPLFSESHGTAVASAAVGFTSGIAWGADITMFSAQNPDPRKGGDYVPLTADLYQGALNENLDILNMSLGEGPGANGAIQAAWTESDVRRAIGNDVINVWAQPGVSEKTIMVWAAGNNNGRTYNKKQPFNAHSPSLDAGAMRFIPELRGHWIAVVATDRAGEIADFSNRCGLAAEWCIAAPGERVRVASYNSSDYGAGTNLYEDANGTSYAAPMVSGGLAVMKQLFRDQLSNTELVSRLFATAKKSGIHANESIYGQGLMDLGAATNPWGTPAFMSTKVISDDGFSITSSVMSVGSSMGDSLNQTLGEEEVAAFDALGAPFWYQASDFTLPSQGTSLATRLDRFLAPSQQRSIPTTWKLDYKADALATTTGHLALTHGASRLSLAGPHGFSATAFHRSQDHQQSPLDALTLSWTPAPFPSLTFEAGYLGEQKSLLGGQGRGAFGQLSGETIFLSAQLATSTPQGWQLAAQGELGMVNPSAAKSQFISDLSSLSTTAFRLEASRPLFNGSTLRVALAQPLRVESGAMTLSLPTGRTKEGVVIGKNLSAPLAPTGRQLDLSAKLEFPGLGGDISFGATRSAQPQHQQSASPEWTFFTGYRTTW